jgi:MYXO-CTERM domain-containing protein
MRVTARLVSRVLFLALVSTLPAQAAETVIDLSGQVPDDELRHFFLEFDVPEGIQEIQVQHDDLSADNILDWGLEAPNGVFRGWGGGNTEDAVINVAAASRSYIPGPIAAGKWRVVVGKAKVKVTPALFSVHVTLRDTTTLAAQPERAPYQPTPAVSKEARWYAGDFHVHSVQSGDAQATFDQIVELSQSIGLDFVMLSDHNTNAQLDFYADFHQKHPDFLLLPGVEYTTYWGHANGIGATEWVSDRTELPDNSIVQAAQKFHDQGALFSINHPALDIGDACIGCAWAQDLPPEQIDAVEIATGFIGLVTTDAISYWDQLSLAGRHSAALGGSDDHTAGIDEGPTGRPIGIPTTMVYASELSLKGIQDGIRNGRTVVRFEGMKDPMIELVSSVAPSGDTVHATTTTLKATVSGGVGYSLRFVKNGEPQGSEPVEITEDPYVGEVAVSAPADGEDFWRVEALNSGLRPRTVTSNLWITAEGAPPPASAEEEDGGCGCRTSPVPSQSGFLATLALVAFAGLRRRAHGRRHDHR